MSSNRDWVNQMSGDPDEATPASSMPTITTGKILALALPSLGALIAEPLFTIIDSTMVGHLGTPQLAGLGVASTVLNTAVGLFIFLAYSTTSLTGRHLGAGRRDLALRSGIEAMWLAGGIGAVAAILLAAFASPLLTWLGADAATLPHALAYLRSSAPGLIGMFVVLAATGTLRGLQDTRTPLIAASVGAAFNAVANWVLMYPLGLEAAARPSGPGPTGAEGARNTSGAHQVPPDGRLPQPRRCEGRRRTGLRCPWVAAGPGRASRRRAEPKARGADGERAGRRPRAHKAARRANCLYSPPTPGSGRPV